MRRDKNDFTTAIPITLSEWNWDLTRPVTALPTTGIPAHAATLQTWLNEGVLKRDAQPAVYLSYD